MCVREDATLKLEELVPGSSGQQVMDLCRRWCTYNNLIRAIGILDGIKWNRQGKSSRLD